VRARVAARRRGVKCIFADNPVCGDIGLMVDEGRKEDAYVDEGRRKRVGPFRRELLRLSHGIDLATSCGWLMCSFRLSIESLVANRSGPSGGCSGSSTRFESFVTNLLTMVHDESLGICTVCRASH